MLDTMASTTWNAAPAALGRRRRGNNALANRKKSYNTPPLTPFTRSTMPRYILTIDDRCFGSSAQVNAFTAQLDGQSRDDTLGDHPDRPLRKLLELPEDAITIAGETRHSDWERLAPCPECGHTRYTVAQVRKSVYEASNVELIWLKDVDFWGPILSVRCRRCEAQLVHYPYDILRR